MTRSIAITLALAALLAPGCSKSKSAPESTGSGSAAVGSAATGSAPSAGSGVDNAAVDAMVNDMMAYTDKVVPMMLAFDGDCAAQAKRMLELEPLAQKIRAEGEALEGSPASQSAFRAAMAGKKAEVMARMKAKLEAAGTNEEAMDKTEKAMNDKCANDPAFQDAMNHVGLRKKKG